MQNKSRINIDLVFTCVLIVYGITIGSTLNCNLKVGEDNFEKEQKCEEYCRILEKKKVITCANYFEYYLDKTSDTIELEKIYNILKSFQSMGNNKEEQDYITSLFMRYKDLKANIGKSSSSLPLSISSSSVVLKDYKSEPDQRFIFISVILGVSVLNLILIIILIVFNGNKDIQIAIQKIEALNAKISQNTSNVTNGDILKKDLDAMKTNLNNLDKKIEGFIKSTEVTILNKIDEYIKKSEEMPTNNLLSTSSLSPVTSSGISHSKPDQYSHTIEKTFKKSVRKFWVGWADGRIFSEELKYKSYECETNPENEDEAYLSFSNDSDIKSLYFANPQERIYGVADPQASGNADKESSITTVKPGVLKRVKEGWALTQKATIKFS